MAQTERPRTPETKTRNRRSRSPDANRPWGRDDFFNDLQRASRLTDEINAEPGAAERLRSAREHAREGKLITQAELDAELEKEDDG
jgi:hypothetical protein